MNIAAFHLFNDFSGSPLVLKNVLQGFVNHGQKVRLYTSPGMGFLSGINGIDTRNVPYIRGRHKITTLVSFVWAQLSYVFIAFFLPKKTIIYINTLLPFGAALGGYLSGKKVIYHIHEPFLNPKLLDNFLKTIVAMCHYKVVFVSQYLKQCFDQYKLDGSVVYNALSDDFLENVAPTSAKIRENGDFRVLMLASLKKYKGVDDFVQLASKMPDVSFELVLNSNQESIDQYFGNSKLSNNLKIFSCQQNVHPFYKRAHVVLNLSHPCSWIESFGMTILEAHSYGLPVIVPPIGGITEIVHDKINGFHIAHSQMKAIEKVLRSLKDYQSLYLQMSARAKENSSRFNMDLLHQQICEVVTGYVPYSGMKYR